MLRACREEAELSLFGRFVTHWDTIRFLSNLLRLREEERRAPKILEERIERPIFIAGLPRSGTTFLHSLLAEDDTNLVPKHLAADPSLSARARAGPAAAPGRPTVAHVWRARTGVPAHAPDRCLFAAGVLRDHGTCLCQLALRYDLPGSELSPLA